MTETDRAKALALLDCALARNPKLPMAYVLRSQLYYHRGLDDRALDDADSAVRLAPRHYRAYQVRALLHDYYGDYQHAIRDLESAVFYNPRWLVGYLELALHHLALGAAEKALDALLTLDAYGGADPLRYNAAVMAGLIYEENLRDFDAAIQAYTYAITLRPDRRPAYLMRAWALRAQGSYKQAAKDIVYANACPQPAEDYGLYDWLQAQYDPWLYLIAPDPDDRRAWLAVLRNAKQVAKPVQYTVPDDPRFFFN